MKRLGAVLFLALALAGCKDRNPVATVTPPDEPKEAVAEPIKEEPPSLSMPSVPRLADAPRALIVYYEVDSRSAYERIYKWPTWPKGYSGVTVGIGDDLRYKTAARIMKDWAALPDDRAQRLSTVAGLGGTSARDALPTVKNVEVPWGIANDVFDEVDTPNLVASTKSAFPGVENLRENAFGSLVSLVYNRGADMGVAGDNRVDMRTIRKLVPKKDYAGIAAALRNMPVTMYAVWTRQGVYNGLKARCEAQAVLVETP